MRVMLSTIGSRGDVQPLVALALHLKTLGQGIRVCVPPDFREWIEGLGIPVTPIGPEVRKFAASRPTGTRPQTPPTLEQRQQMAEATVATQFETLTAAAQGCDIIVAATALQIAARSVAEKMGIPYVFAAYSPTVLPSPHHPPPPLPPLPGQTPPSTNDNGELWARNAARFHDLFGPALNAHRASLGLAPVQDVRSHMFTDRPWLAADPILGPWPDPSDKGVFQTGAWILPDERPLSRELATFLESGEPPIYFGFGSTRAPQDAGSCDAPGRSRSGTAGDRVARVVRCGARGQRGGLSLHRRSQRARPLLTRRCRRPSRWRGNDRRSRARRCSAGRRPGPLRPALLGTASPHARHWQRARTQRANDRFTDHRSRAHPAT